MYPTGGGQQWGQPGQQQGGYQQPQQTGYMQSQPTGYPQQGGYMQAQQTGYPQQQQRPMQPGMGMAPQQTGFMGQQPTGMMGSMGMGRPMGVPSPGMLGPGGSGQMMPQGGQQRFLSPNTGMLPQQTGMMMPQHTAMPMGMSNMTMRSPQPTGFMSSQPTGFMGPQPTGFMGAQPTGMPMDPRLQLMSTQFLPAMQPFSGAPTASNMNFSNASMQPSNFQSSIQNLSQQQQGSREPKIPWALSKEERKSYDSIFRAWDQQATGFISGDVAREVFGQSGIDRDSLMQIWHLSDTENRGKLNQAEFHVAMGLIYRALNGNEVPSELPPDLVPPSAKQLNESVDFLKDLLKRDTTVRTSTGLNLPEAGSNRNASYSKSHSLYQNPVAPKQDATAYKHEDTSDTGYRSSSRHLDRNTVRFKGESKADDLSEMKRQLENTQRMLDSRDDEDNEDEREIEKEMEDLRFRIRRIQDDIDYYNRRGGRDAADQRRKAERELMQLMHERLPQLERRLEEKDKKKRDKKLDESRARDLRNQEGNRRGASSTYDSDRERDRYDSSRSNGEYLRGSYERRDDRDRERSRDRYDDDRNRDYDSSQRRDRDRNDRVRSPPPAPASPAQNSRAAPAPPAAAAPALSPATTPAPAATPAAGPPKNMTPEERQAWIRSEAQRRISERMQALGASAPPSTATDSSVEDRLRAERAEADARAAAADQESAAREQARRARLEEQKLAKDKTAVNTVKSELAEAAKGPDAPPAPVLQAAREQIDEDEQMIRRREEVLAKEKSQREARFKKLQEEEEEAQRQEELFKERQGKFSGKTSQPATPSALPPPSRKKAGGPPPPPPTRSRAAPTPAAAAAPPPQAPPAVSPPATSTPVASTPSAAPSGGPSSTNPFHRLQGGGVASPAAAGAPGGTNPFFRGGNDAGAVGSPKPSPAAVNANLPPASRPAAKSVPSAAPAARGPSGPRPPPPSHDDDWGDSDKEEEDDDDDDGPGSTTRATRQNLAQALFSGLVPSGGGSSGRSTPTPTNAAPSSAPPAPPAAPPAPQAPPAPSAPPAPAAPAAPPAPPGAFPSPAAAPSAPAGPVDRGALLGQIAGGLKLKKAVTRDASGPPVSGKVIGDAAPPVQKYVPPPSPPPAPSSDDPSAADDSFASRNPNRQSVDWANNLAADQMNGGPPRAAFVPDEPSLREEEESDDDQAGPESLDGPSLAHRAAPGLDTSTAHGSLSMDTPAALEGDAAADALDDFDTSRTIRVRTLYPYAGQRDEDLSFEENALVLAHPGKDVSSDWMYGTLLTGGAGKKGLFPKAYAAELTNAVHARALYDFAGGSIDEASFSEGDELKVVDQEDASWWKVEHGDSIKIAPATYLEIIAGTHGFGHTQSTQPQSKAEPNTQDLSTADAVSASSQRLDSASQPSSAENAQSRGVSQQTGNGGPPAATYGRDAEDSQDEDEYDSDSTTGWSSSSDEDNDDPNDTPSSEVEAQEEEEETEEAHEARAAERMRVLEAAGLLVKSGQGQGPPPPPGARPAENLLLRRKATVRRGPKPEAPARKRTAKKVAKPERPLPAPPTSARDAPEPERHREEQMEDAYDRFTKLQSEMNNMRVSFSAQSSAGSASGSHDQPFAAPPSTESLSVTTPPPRSGTGTPAGDTHPSETTPESRSGGRFSSFASSLRSKAGQLTASQPERRATPVISGPMSNVTENADQPMRTPSSSSSAPPPPSATSSTWGSFVGSEALATLPDKERKRQEAIFELCQTEATHVRDLQTIIEVFYNSIEEQKLLDDKARMVIFANIEDVMIAAVSFLSDLEERQRTSRLYVDRIGDILSRHIPAMRVYLPYCTNQTTASQILQAERARNQPLDNLLGRLRAGQGRGLDLASYLLTPMQRMTRYPLLIGQILKYTEADHADWEALKRANTIAEGILASTNERIRENESRERLRLLSQTLYVGDEARIDLTKPTRFMGDRRILKEEVLGKAKSKSGRKLTLILCNDLLLILTGPHLYRMPAPLEEIVVKEASSGIKSRAEGTFQIVIGGTEKIGLRCSSVRACHYWMRSIEEARSECLAAAMASQADSRQQRRRSSKLA